jgi:hypothetical protein
MREGVVVDELDEDVVAAAEDAIVDGLAGLLEVCSVLHEHRLSQGIRLDQLATRCNYEAAPLECIDDGDLAAPVEALAYYAAALGLTVTYAVGPATGVTGVLE